jgi:hypothetical protein
VSFILFCIRELVAPSVDDDASQYMSDVELRCVRRIGNHSFRILRKLLGPSRSLARLAQ